MRIIGSNGWSQGFSDMRIVGVRDRNQKRKGMEGRN